MAIFKMAMFEIGLYLENPFPVSEINVDLALQVQESTTTTVATF